MDKSTNILVVIILGTLATVAVLWSLERNNTLNLFSDDNATSTPVPTSTPTTQESAHTRLDDITDNPESYIGNQVTVQGEVDDVIGRNAIVLDVPGDIIADEILVISKTDIGDSVAEAENFLGDDEVRLTGTVSVFVFVSYQDTLDPDLTADVMELYEGEIFILTDSIEIADES